MKAANSEGVDWFLLFKEGDKEAFRQLFDQYYRSILYFTSSILLQEPYAEDIVVEVFQKAWLRRTKFDTRKHFENFLYFAARNACISFLRSARVQRNTRQEFSRLAEDTDASGQPVDVEKVQAQLMEKLNRHLDNLNGGEVLRMAYLEGKSTSEIAAALNITENNVYIIKSRALKSLRQLMAGDNLLLLFALSLFRHFL